MTAFWQQAIMTAAGVVNCHDMTVFFSAWTLFSSVRQCEKVSNLNFWAPALVSRLRCDVIRGLFSVGRFFALSGNCNLKWGGYYFPVHTCFYRRYTNWMFHRLGFMVNSIFPLFAFRRLLFLIQRCEKSHFDTIVDMFVIFVLFWRLRFVTVRHGCGLDGG